jgi:hypothetical protein
VVKEFDRRRRWWRRWLAGAAALVLLAGAVAAGRVVAAGGRNATRTPSPAAESAVTAEALARGRWDWLPDAPVPRRDSPVAVWTGRELLVWGGVSGPHGRVLHGDGAAYDPARRAWRRLPPAPLTPRIEAAAVWTRRELVVWGGDDRLDPGGLQVTADGAAYNPVRGTWRRLPPAPLSARAGATAIWTGREVLVVGGRPVLRTEWNRSHTDGAAWDPVHGSWRRLAPSPQLGGRLVDQHLVWAGARLLVWSDWEQVHRSAVTLPDGQRGTLEERRDGVDAWAYNPAADRWAVLPAAPGQPALGGAVLVWTGREVLSVAGRPYHGPALDRNPGARYDPARNRWRPLAGGPLDTAAGPAGLWTGAALLVWNSESERGGGDPRTAFRSGDGAVWDPRVDRWVRLPRSPSTGGSGSVAVWTGRGMLVWGGTWWPASAHSGMAFTPAGA